MVKLHEKEDVLTKMLRMINYKQNQGITMQPWLAGRKLLSLSEWLLTHRDLCACLCLLNSGNKKKSQCLDVMILLRNLLYI